jgi:hypothetical protein
MQGPTGSTGERGEQGERGERGFPGPRGERGCTGPAGYPGERGSPGCTGPRGCVGPVGERGEPGPSTSFYVEGSDNYDGCATNGSVRLHHNDSLKIWSNTLEIVVERGDFGPCVNIEQVKAIPGPRGPPGPVGPSGKTLDKREFTDLQCLVDKLVNKVDQLKLFMPLNIIKILKTFF